MEYYSLTGSYLAWLQTGWRQLFLVIDIIFHPKERAFLEKWFGEELHFPMPLATAFLAKGAEPLGGILVFLGLFTRPASWLIAFTNDGCNFDGYLGENFIIDGGFTISYFLFALILIYEGGGKYSLDFLLSKKSVHRVA